jgi:hypothetical protein
VPRAWTSVMAAATATILRAVGCIRWDWTVGTLTAESDFQPNDSRRSQSEKQSPTTSFHGFQGVELPSDRDSTSTIQLVLGKRRFN